MPSAPTPGADWGFNATRWGTRTRRRGRPPPASYIWRSLDGFVPGPAPIKGDLDHTLCNVTMEGGRWSNRSITGLPADPVTTMGTPSWGTAARVAGAK
ncbi:protein of unknown function [Streptantibioticus cattleyicolor NRRL 8057 = DSM 46488]|nr:protein of unknown function [Streptantibioticus cattleyicolor NRRL 8057 = DSM 46488]